MSLDLVELGLFLKLTAVLVLIVPVLWAVRRLVSPSSGRTGRGRLIQVLEARALPEGRVLYLVQVGERHLLLGGSKDALSLLAELPDLHVPASLAADESEASQFSWRESGVLARARAKWLAWRRGSSGSNGSWSHKQLREEATCGGQDA